MIPCALHLTIAHPGTTSNCGIVSAVLARNVLASGVPYVVQSRDLVDTALCSRLSFEDLVRIIDNSDLTGPPHEYCYAKR